MRNRNNYINLNDMNNYKRNQNNFILKNDNPNNFNNQSSWLDFESSSKFSM